MKIKVNQGIDQGVNQGINRGQSREIKQNATDSMSFHEIIRVNVGGRRIETSRSILTKIPGSMLEKMFSNVPPASQIEGAYFIDADPVIFDAILAWLRYGVIDLKNVSLEHLTAATSYFGLEDMHKQLLDRQTKMETEETKKRVSDLQPALIPNFMMETEETEKRVSVLQPASSASLGQLDDRQKMDRQKMDEKCNSQKSKVLFKSRLDCVMLGVVFGFLLSGLAKNTIRKNPF